MLVIWSLSRSDNGTRMLCSDEFCWGTSFSMDCQRHETLQGTD